MTHFPIARMRRLRRTRGLRRAFAESRVVPADFVAPLFVKEGLDEPVAIGPLPGHHQHTIESVRKEARELVSRGISTFLLFGVPATKDRHGEAARAPDGIGQRALTAVKEEVGDEGVVISDLCLCSYTEHGHCGVLRDDGGGTIDNDATIDIYGAIAEAQARAGADIVAPSGMMDGQVAAIRRALDEGGLEEVAILSYAAKFASSFYGPFRAAAEGAPQFGDRRSYQADPANRLEAVREAALDVAEGADALMVKPALAYLDVLRAVKDEFGLPTAAYNVSGEYSMLAAAAAAGWLDERAAVLEVLSSIKRAGADLVITYHARQAAEWLS